MFTIAGILADEEPKTPISTNGLYNSSRLDGSSGDFYLSSTLIGGTSEATLMAWFYISPSTPSNFQVYPYREVLAGKVPVPIYFLEDAIKSSFPNANGGNNVCTYSTTTPINQWIHVAVTWSVSNSRMRIYLNGVQQASSVMTYANSSTTSAFFDDLSGTVNDVDISQFNVYNRELTGVEVAEHYVEQDGQVGVLAYDAMTIAQRSGLIYCSSLTNDISFDGNEFKDRSGNNTTLSPLPALTGQQIYVYTDASTTQLFPANAINLDGSTQYLELQGDSSRLDVGTDSLTLSFWANVKTSSTRERIRAYFKGETSSTGENEISIQILEDDSFFVGLSKTSLQGRYYYDTAIDGVEGWAHFLVVVSRSNDSDSGSLYVNGVLYTGSVTFDYQDSGWSSTNYTYTQPVYLGAQVRSTITYAQTVAFYGISIGQSFGQSDAEYLYNEGNPLCADYVETDNPTLYNKFDAWFDNATYNGSTELQALTDKVNGWVLDNVNNAPFDGKSALIVSDGSAQYNSAVVELDGSTQYLELQGSASRLNIGLNTIAVSSWTDGSSATTLYRKYESESTTSPNTSRAEIFIGGTSKDLIFQFITLGNQYNIKFQNINWTGEDKHILIYWDRLGNNLSNLHCYINGEEHTDKVFNSPLSGNPNSINWDMSLPVLWGKRNWAGYGQWENVAKFISISIGQAFTQSDAEYLYNNGNPLTADYVETDNPTLYNKFDAWFDNATYNGSTELQALTDKVNGWVLDNVNDAPFNSGLAVECDEAPRFPVNAINLNGIDQRVDYGDSFNLTNQEFGFAFWVKFNELNSHVYIFSKYRIGGIDPKRDYYLFQEPSTNELKFDITTTGQSATNRLTTSFSPDEDQWYHICVTRVDLAGVLTAKVYIDSVLVKQEAFDHTIYSSTEPFYLGYQALIDSYSSIGLYNFRVTIGDHYTQSDVDQMYAGGSTAFCYEDQNQTLKDKDEAYNRLGSYNDNAGNELNDLTGNGYVPTNSNNAPFNSTGLSVECS